MKASELMIGDWVMIKDYPMKAMPKQISPEYYTRSLVEIESIPLTPEILEKNGWKITGCKDAKYYWHNEVPFNIPIEPYNHWREDEDRIFADDFFDSVFIRLGYVHELQHALKLCEIEKEIVL